MFLVEKEQIPWDALEFVVGQINYGGRVTDDNDRRCLMAILRKYIQPDVLKDSYLFTPSGLYYCPATATSTLAQMRAYIEALPPADPPEVFSMHPNANIQSQLQETLSVLNLVVAMQPRIAGSKSGDSPEETIYKMAEKLLEEIPPVRSSCYIAVVDVPSGPYHIEAASYSASSAGPSMRYMSKWLYVWRAGDG
jgi:dynein heavy chain, axonemal